MVRASIIWLPRRLTHVGRGPRGFWASALASPVVVHVEETLMVPFLVTGAPVLGILVEGSLLDHRHLWEPIVDG